MDPDPQICILRTRIRILPAIVQIQQDSIQYTLQEGNQIHKKHMYIFLRVMTGMTGGGSPKLNQTVIFFIHFCLFRLRTSALLS